MGKGVVRAGIDGVHIFLWCMGQALLRSTSCCVSCGHNGTLERWMRRPSRKVGRN